MRCFFQSSIHNGVDRCILIIWVLGGCRGVKIRPARSLVFLAFRPWEKQLFGTERFLIKGQIFLIILYECSSNLFISFFMHILSFII